ncbi:MAG: undecaprenyl-diphosphate phosphatase [Anaerolineae bacterium]|nr:undecaprenyl-diphosphate phosphatase [Anaerolineae bacterium]
MTLLQVILLGILQGLTEFLPVSSSGHLVIVPYLLKWPNPGLVVDAMLHLGTILAVIVYFWKDLWQLAIAALQSLQKRSLADPNARLAWCLALATIPGAVGGLLLEDMFETWFGMPKAAAGFLLGTAALLLLAEFLGKKTRTLTALSWIEALIIGFAQMFAIAPGLSRSGATIATGMLLGYRRDEAARFSFLLSVPIILGSGGYQILKIFGESIGNVSWGMLGAGIAAAAISGYLAITGLLALVRRQSLWPFAVYCAVFATLVLTGILQ